MREVNTTPEAGGGIFQTTPYPTDLQLLSSRLEEVPSTSTVPAVPAHLQSL